MLSELLELVDQFSIYELELDSELEDVLKSGGGPNVEATPMMLAVPRSVTVPLDVLI